MTEMQLLNVIQASVGFLFLIELLLVLWPSCRLDVFRQEMFAVRDELFDYAASGKVSFDHPAYKLLRQSMNGFIRYGHRLTFFRLWMTISEWRVLRMTPEYTWEGKWKEALKALPDERTADQLRQFHAKALSRVVSHVISGSPVLIFILLGFVGVQILRSGWSNLKKLCHDGASFAVSKFVDLRLLEEDATRIATQ